MSRKLIIIWSCAGAMGMAGLSGCADREQTIGSNIKQDTQSFQGTSRAYATSGWKQGDRLSWEQHMKTRTQNGQNEYNKVN